jgi:hypothetical protein
MAERNSWAVSDSPNGVITTEDARIAVSALMQAGPSPSTSRNGIRPGVGDPGTVAAAAPTPNKTVTVQPFQMFMRAARGTGSYVQTLDAVKSLDLLTDSPAHAANARYDLIVAQQSDKFYGDDNNTFAVRQIVGTPSGTPADPTVPGSADFFLLARVRIAAGATTITADMIDDLRPAWTVGLGGLIPVRNAAERDAIATFPGVQAYRQDRRWVEVHDGTAWRIPNIPVCSSLADITAAITNPYLGQWVFNTADNLLYRWNGSGWVGSIATGAPNTAASHEARYEVRGGQGQSFPPADVRISFPTAVYTTPDVTITNNNVFTLNRSGLWHISVSNKITGNPGTANYAAYLGIADSPSNFGLRYANSQVNYNGGGNGALACSTNHRFPAGTQLCAIFWHTSTANLTQDLTWANVNNITLTWLRP